MKRLNLDRMRRYRARNSPDRLVRVFDRDSREAEVEYMRWSRQFYKDMRAKHGVNLIDVFVHQEVNHPSLFPNKVRFVLEAVVR